MKQLGYKIIDYIVAHHLELPTKRVHNVGSYEELSALVKSDLPIDGEPADRVFEEVDALLKNYLGHIDHPRFFSFIPGPSN